MLLARHHMEGVFLRKSKGGLRPIALIQILACLRGKLRRPLIEELHELNDRPYWWSITGRNIDKLVLGAGLYERLFQRACAFRP